MPRKQGEGLTAFVLVTKVSSSVAKNGRPFVSFDCRTKEGERFTGCKIWDYDGDMPSGVIKVKGSIDLYNDDVQIKVERWRPLTEGDEEEESDFEPKAPWPLDIDSLEKRYAQLLSTVLDEPLADFTGSFIDFWSDHRFPSMTLTSRSFKEHQGARDVHHAYRHGLFEHSIEVAEFALATSRMHQLNDHEEDLVVVGGLIHDIGKLEEHEPVCGAYDYTQLGKAYGWSSSAHLYIGSQMLAVYYAIHGGISEEDFMVLQNVIMSHHGSFGHVKPKYLVSTAIHCADMASSQLNRMRQGLLATDKPEVTRDIVRESYLRVNEYPDAPDVPDGENLA